MSKDNLSKGLVKVNPVKYWPHWTAVIKENRTGQRYAVDSWLYDKGENPAVVKVEDWLHQGQRVGARGSILCGAL